MIYISVNSLPPKIQIRFPQDPKYDVIIQHKSRSYRLQQAYLRVQSKFFKDNIYRGVKLVQIDEDFQQVLFHNVMSCFYGYSLKVKRSEVLSYFKIIKFLRISILYRVFSTDIAHNLAEYDFFQVLQDSFLYNQQTIFELCLYQLKQKKFEQIKRFTSSLIKTPISIFKLVIKSYNKENKTVKLLSPYQIEELIMQYCKCHNLDFNYSSSLKMQLIDKNNLTSYQYRDIFLLDENMAKNFQENTMKKKNQKLSQIISASLPMNNNQQTAIKDWNISHRSLMLGMETTFQQKIQMQLTTRQQLLLAQIRQQKKECLKQVQKSCMLKDHLIQVHNKARANTQNKIISEKISKINRKLTSFQSLMSQTDTKLKSLIDQSQSLTSKYSSKEKSMMEMSIADSRQSLYQNQRQFRTPQSSNKFNKMQNYQHKNNNNTNRDVTSQKQGFKKNGTMHKKSKPPVNTTQTKANKNIWKCEQHLEFNINPTVIKTQKQLTNLADIIAPNRFNYKKLDLILKRTKNGISFGTALDLKCHKQVLVIFRTDQDKVAGGRVSVEIPILAEDYVQDPSAIIFSVTDNKKFRIKKTDIDQAIMITDGYIICFNTDLMISEKCLEVDNYCSWPNAYQQNKQLKCNTPQWLVGDQQFRIIDLECYHIYNYEEREMII